MDLIVSHRSPLFDGVAVFLEHLAVQRRLPDTTMNAYGRDLAGFCSFISGHLGRSVVLADMGTISAPDIRSYLASRRREDGVGASTLARNLSALRSFFRFCARRWDIDNTQIDLVQSPKVSRRLPRPVSQAGIEKAINIERKGILPWIAARDKAVLLLLYGAGLRISEALSITADLVPLQDQLKLRGKGGRERIVPILPIVASATNEYVQLYPHPLAPERPAFRGVRGGALGARAVQHLIASLRGQLNLDPSATPHAFRHSFATHLLAEGADLRSIQELLGHASLSSTQIYTQVDMTSLRKTHNEAHPRA